MRKILLLSLIIVAAAPSAGAAQLDGGCQSRMTHSFKQIELVVHNNSMINALRVRPTITREAVHAIHGALNLSHIVDALDRRVSQNPQLITNQKVRSEMCLAATAMHDYSHALRILVEEGEHLERDRGSSVTLDRAGVGPGPRARSAAAQAQTITQSRTYSREYSNSVQRSHNESWSHTQSESYAAAAARETDHVQSLSRSLSDQSSVSASRGSVYTTNQTLLCPPAGCPTGPDKWKVMVRDGLCTPSMGCYPPRSALISPPSRAQARLMVNRTTAAAAAVRSGVSGGRLRTRVRAQLRAAHARANGGH